MFINRTAELGLLEKRFASGKAEFFVLYGRRRVGKTELLAHFCEGKRAIFFVADLGSEISLRMGLSRVVNAVLFGPGQLEAVYTSWEALFQAVGQAAKNERLVLVLDEFPYIVSTYPPLATILQKVWDQMLKNTQLMLILCGSYIGMMEETVLGYQAPLYGRRTAQYLLEPLLFRDARLFFQSYTLEDQVRTYAVFGGTPAYLQTIDPELSLAQNILEGILSRGSFLYDEVHFVLQQELREPKNYFAILQAIAAGRTKLNEIKQATGIESPSVYLETLEQLQLVERIVPITETQPQKSRRGLYRLKDHFLRFWFRYVHPNRSQLERGAANLVLESQVIPELDHFSSLAFEEICAQALWQKGLAGELPFVPERIGRWWSANEEIDLIAMNADQAMLVECKWSSQPVGTNIVADLERKAELVQAELGDRRISYALCARSGFTLQLRESAQRRGNVLLFDLNDLVRNDDWT